MSESSIPYGFCQCGCGERTTVHKGRTRDYVYGHGRRGPSAIRSARVTEYRAQWAARGIKYGLCLCGCGERTLIWDDSDFRRLRILGEPRMWIAQHDKRSAPHRWIEEDRGYETPCWIWQWSLNQGGYGQYPSGGMAHRGVYEELGNPIPEGRHLDHLCRVRACVNPDHLEPVTQTENNRRQPNQKLTMELARAIRQEYVDWDEAQWAFCRKVALRHGMHPETIRALLDGQIWKEGAS